MWVHCNDLVSGELRRLHLELVDRLGLRESIHKEFRMEQPKL